MNTSNEFASIAGGDGDDRLDWLTVGVGNALGAGLSLSNSVTVSGEGGLDVITAQTGARSNATSQTMSVGNNTLISGGTENDDITAAIGSTADASGIADTLSNRTTITGGAGDDHISGVMEARSSGGRASWARGWTNHLELLGEDGEDQIDVRVVSDIGVGELNESLIRENSIQAGGGAGADSLRAEVSAQSTGAVSGALARSNSNQLRLSGGEQNDVLVGVVSADTRFGGGTVEVVANAISLEGGAGEDALEAVVVLQYVVSPADVRGNRFVLAGGDGDDTLRFTETFPGYSNWAELIGGDGVDSAVVDNTGVSAAMTYVASAGFTPEGLAQKSVGIALAVGDPGIGGGLSAQEVETLSVLGGSGGDTFTGSPDHAHVALVDDDDFSGNGGDDTFTGIFGNDRFDGGVGNDTAVFEGRRSGYRVTQLGDGSVQVEDIRTAAIDVVDAYEGVDTYRNVERFRFADGEHDLAFLLSNHAPVVAQPAPEFHVGAGNLFSFGVAGAVFEDPDTGIRGLTYTATQAGGGALPEWLGIDGTTGRLSGTPLDSDVGPLSITVTAADAEGLSASHTIALDVEPNRRPTGTVSIIGTVKARSTLVVTNTLVDPDGPAELGVTYRWLVNDQDFGIIGQTWNPHPRFTGMVITVAATYTDANGIVETVFSAPSAPLAPLAPETYSGGTGTDTHSSHEINTSGSSTSVAGGAGDDQVGSTTGALAVGSGVAVTSSGNTATVSGDEGADMLAGEVSAQASNGASTTTTGNATTVSGGTENDQLAGELAAQASGSGSSASTTNNQLVLDGGDGNDTVAATIIATQDAGATASVADNQVTLFGGTGDDTLSLVDGTPGGNAVVLDGGDGTDAALIDYSSASSARTYELTDGAAPPVTARIAATGPAISALALDVLDAGAAALAVATLPEQVLADGTGSITLRGIEALRILGGTSGDTFRGASADDDFAGGGGADAFTGNGGNDRFDGGAGTDTAAFDGRRSDYRVSQLAGGAVQVEDLRAGAPDGTDQLVGVESYQFADGTFELAALLTRNRPPAGSVIIAGAPRVGSVLSAVDTLVDPDGPTRLAVSYQWRANGTDIAGATAASLVVPGALLGQAITVVARYTDLGGTAEAIESGATAAVVASTPTSGTARAETVAGGAGNDQLFGLGGADTLQGQGGDDVLDGGTGGDRLLGGAGNDTYVLDGNGDVVVEAANEGIDLVRTSLSSYELGASVENLAYAGTRSIDARGNALDNVMTAGSGNDALDGRGGSDRLIGAAGRDDLDGGAGDDLLDGGAGNDTMSGGAGNDTYVVDSSGDAVSEGGGANGGTDTVLTTLAAFTLGANLENLVFVGTGSFAGMGNGLGNVITGGTGSDVLTGRGGADTMTGGAGSDLFVLAAVGDSGTSAATRDVIVDFDAALDELDLSAIDANTALGGNQAFTLTGSGPATLSITYDSASNTTVVAGNVNATVAPEFSIALVGNYSGLLTAANIGF